MKKLLSLLTAVMLLPLVLGAQELAPNQKLLGHYTTDDIALGGCWGKSLISGVRPIATDLTADELAFFQGSKIIAFRVGLSESTPVTRVFVIPIDGNGNLQTETEWSCDISQEGWNVVTLDDPYLINLPADYKLRIGFDYEQTRTNKPISAVDVGTLYPTYVYRNNSWVNYGINTIGNLSLQVICENDNFPAYAIRVRDLKANPILIIGKPYPVKFQACNLGISQVDAGQCTFNMMIDGEVVGTTTNPTALTANYSDVDCTFPTAGLTPGEHTLAISTVTANGEVLENPMTITLTVKAYESGFPRQMRLVEQFTSTGCTWCPTGSRALQALCDMRGDVAWVAIHEAFGSPTDPFVTSQTDSIENYEHCTGYPLGSFDRTAGIEEPGEVCGGLGYSSATGGAQVFNDFLESINVAPAWSSININSTFDSQTRKAEITISGELVPDFDDRMGTDAKLTVYIIEDGLVASQIDQGNIVNDYVHNNVLRFVPGGVRGVNINKNGQTYENVFTVDIPTSWNADKLNIVAFISRPLRANALTDLCVDQTYKRKLGENDSSVALRGDVDGDDKVNIDDVSILIDCMLNGIEPANPQGADCYPDGRITVDDVTMLIDFLLNGTWAEE